jgi:hypothetical protein
MMFAGRLNIRYELTVILGCSSCSARHDRGPMSSLSGADHVTRFDAPAAAPPIMAPPPAPPPPANRDPYVGASVPAR